MNKDLVHELAVWREDDGTRSATALTVEGADTSGRTIAEVEHNAGEVIGLVLDLPRSTEAAMVPKLRVELA